MRKSWRVKYHQERLQAIRKNKRRIQQNNSFVKLYKSIIKDLRFFMKKKIDTVNVRRAYKLMCRKVDNE